MWYSAEVLNWEHIIAEMSFSSHLRGQFGRSTHIYYWLSEKLIHSTNASTILGLWYTTLGPPAQLGPVIWKSWVLFNLKNLCHQSHDTIKHWSRYFTFPFIDSISNIFGGVLIFSLLVSNVWDIVIVCCVDPCLS